MRGFFCLLAMLVLWPLAASAATDRVALVIGNGSYQHGTRLPNPANDARLIARTLRELEFDVIEHVDLERNAMERAALEFSRRANGARVALVFFAGHGIQMAGSNYLLPVDAKLEDEFALRVETVNLDTLLESVSGATTRLVVLDACRNNPFVSRMRLSSANRNLTRGLGKVEATIGGTLIVYSTRPDDVATDGDGDNSPFSAALAKYMKQPGLDIRQVITRVRNDVLDQTGNRQEPWESSSLREDVFLAGTGVSIVPPTPVAGASTGTLVLEVTPADARVWLGDGLLPAGIREVPNLPPGEVKLKARREGYSEHEIKAYIVAGRSTHAQLTLNALAGSASVSKKRSNLRAAAVDQCDRLAASPDDRTRPSNMPGIALESMDVTRAVKACRPVAEASDEPRHWYQYARAAQANEDHAQAVEWYRKAADRGYAPAQSNLGLMYELGLGARQSNAEAVAWYRKAADQGYALGQNNLGIMYANGLGVAADEAEAIAWYRKAADQGNTHAINNIGNIYNNKHDHAQAAVWYRRAADQGHADAQSSLAALYACGCGIDKDDAQAAYWYRKAADQGDDHAQFELGTRYRYGRGVPQDYAQEIIWYRKAAEQGHPWAQTGLGYMYRNGRGVSQDYKEALNWFRKAADRGYVGAQNALGLMYDEGKGVPQNYTQAIAWYRKAADQGDVIAQYNLGMTYKKLHNLTQAAEWFRKAAAQGDAEAKSELEKLGSR